MVEPNETFISGERDEVCILIIPHYWLGGVGLIILSDPPGLDLRWAAVTDLSDHDQIDLGHVVDRWQLPVKRQMNELAASLEQELSRPIEWMCTIAAARPAHGGSGRFSTSMAGVSFFMSCRSFPYGLFHDARWSKVRH